MAETDSSPTEPLRYWLDVLGWSPERLVSRFNEHRQARRARIVLSAKAPYHWLNGARPNEPVPGLVALVLSEATGARITVATLGWDRPGCAHFLLADDGLTDMWVTGHALATLRRAVIRS